MSIHIHLYDTKAVVPYGTQHKVVDLADLRFESVHDALTWWNRLEAISGLTDKSIREVIMATGTEYVGTEHELMTKDGHYSSIGLSIEGQVGVKTFDKRLPDFYADEIIHMGDRTYQLNGHTGHGANEKKTWMQVHLNGNVDFRPSSVPSDSEG